MKGFAARPSVLQDPLRWLHGGSEGQHLPVNGVPRTSEGGFLTVEPFPVLSALIPVHNFLTFT